MPFSKAFVLCGQIYHLHTCTHSVLIQYLLLDVGLPVECRDLIHNCTVGLTLNFCQMDAWRMSVDIHICWTNHNDLWINFKKNRWRKKSVSKNYFILSTLVEVKGFHLHTLIYVYWRKINHRTWNFHVIGHARILECSADVNVKIQPT